MQEEITQKTLALCVETSKMTAQLLQQAMKKVLADMEKHKTNPQIHHGKQTIRQLMKHGAGVSNIEITDQNIKAFSATAKKYGIDFALKKDTTGEIPRYLVFFKGRDADAVTAAFREFSAKNLAKEKKPSIRRRLTNPLMEWGWAREACVRAIEAAGLPQPGKSSCFFCPSMRAEEIIDLREHYPDLFRRALALEDNARANLKTVQGLGRNYSWRERFGKEFI